MRQEVTVSFNAGGTVPPVRIDLEGAQSMPLDAARWWLDDQFTLMECEPLRPTGKLLTADKVLVVAQAAGAAKFGDAKWALEFASAATVALGKSLIAIDIDAMTISY